MVKPRLAMNVIANRGLTTLAPLPPFEAPLTPRNRAASLGVICFIGGTVGCLPAQVNAFDLTSVH